MSLFPRTLEHMKALAARTQLEIAVANHPYNQVLASTAEQALLFLPELRAGAVSRARCSYYLWWYRRV